MRAHIHPQYRPVVFRDRAADFAFLTRSTVATQKAILWQDGNTYPLVDIEASSASHPFWTGEKRIIDSAGRIEKFRSRYGVRNKQARSEIGSASSDVGAQGGGSRAG